MTLGFRAGRRDVAGFVDVVLEEFLQSADDFERFESFGVRGGAGGRPWIAELGNGVGLTLPFEASLGFMIGENDASFRKIYYGEALARIGMGLEAGAFHASVGAQGRYLRGETELPLVLFGLEDDRDLESGNVAAVAEIGYRRSVLELRVIGFAGELDGAAVVLGTGW